jgi:type I restriction enzyme S subunit
MADREYREWAPIRLGDVCTKIGSGATPRGGNDVYLEKGPYALIRSQNIYNDGFHHDGLAFIREDHATELENVEVLSGDVLLNITGDSVARVCQVDSSVLPARVNQHVAIIRPNPERLDPRFLRYLLVSPEMQAKLLSWAGSGGTRNALTKGMIESIEVIAPKKIEQQRAIAHILGTLDDKIELNRKMNETLEAMARAIFKSWFVDFDPVRAKMEGRWRRGESLPGLPAHLCDLFPDRLVDSELGEIPEGWEVRTLGDLVEVTSGKRPDVRHSEPSQQATVPLWGGNGPMAFVPEALVDEPILLTGRVGTLGSVFRITTPCWPSDNTLVVRAKQAAFFEYLFHQLQQIDFASLNRGSTQPLLTQGDLKRQLILMPVTEVLNSFSGFVGILYKRIDESERESRILAAIRDVLLPKLMTGELRTNQ